MYESFTLKQDGGKHLIAGYHWPVEDPAFVVCLIHGIGEWAARYDRIAKQMNQANMAVISMDLRGHGHSCEKKGHCAPRSVVLNDVDQMISWAYHKYPDVPIVLYGHSMGGNINLDYRNRGKFNFVPCAYIISAPWIELVRNVPIAAYRAVKGISKVMPGFRISSNIPTTHLGNPESVGDYDQNPLKHQKISTLCAVDGYDVGIALVQGKLKNNGGAKGKPMLLMHGTEDRVCSIEGSRKIAALEDCTYIEWDGLCHEIHNGGENSTGDEVIRKMIQWIQAL